MAMLLLPGVGDAQTWGTPVALAPPGEAAFSAQSAPLGGGSSIFVYATSAYDSSLAARTIDQSGALGDEQLLTQDATRFPTLAGDSGGEAIAAWYDESTSSTEISVRPAQGSFGAPTVFASTQYYSSESAPRLAVSQAGWAAVAWVLITPDGESLLVSVRPPGGSFAAPQEVAASAVDDALVPSSIAVNDSGEVVVGYMQGRVASVAVRAAGELGTWQPSTALGTPYLDLYPPGPLPLVGIDAAGGAVAVWEEGGGQNLVAGVAASFRPPSGSFGPPEELGLNTWDRAALQLGVSALGEAILVVTPAVQEGNGVGVLQTVAVSGSTVIGRFGAPAELFPGWSDSGVQLAMNARGDAVVMDASSCCSSQLTTRRRAPFGAFDAAQSVSLPAATGSGDSSAPGMISLDGSGNATLSWADVSNSGRTTYVSADGPLVTSAGWPVPPSPFGLAELIAPTAPPAVAPTPASTSWLPFGGGPTVLPGYPSASSSSPGTTPPIRPGSSPDGRLAVAVLHAPGATGSLRIVVGVHCTAACRTNLTSTLVTPRGQRLSLPTMVVTTDVPGTISATLRLSPAANRALRTPAASSAGARRPRRTFRMTVKATAGNRTGAAETASVQLAFIRR
jgi:hypothetical protein